MNHLATGVLTGFAWGQNIRWSNLSTAITNQLPILDILAEYRL